MTEKYHISLRIIHWLMATLILGMIGLGWFMEGLGKEVSYRGTLYFLHKSFGFTVLLLAVLRVVVKIKTKSLPLPQSIPAITRKLAHAGHHLIYLFIFAVPISGYAMSNMFGHGVSWFGLSLPKIFPANKELGGILNETHEILAYIMLGLIILHISGSLKHRFLDKNTKNDVLKRML
jgi:cytochrome b561